MSKFKYEEKAQRNYIAEARDLVKPLRSSELYALYEVVINQQQRSQSAERDAELAAVQKVIEALPDLDRDRLSATKRGYRSSMAADARAKDGNTTKWKRKA